MVSNQACGGRLVIISNRLPVAISKKKGKISIQPSPGGLATALRALESKREILFFGWPGYIPANQEERAQIEYVLIKEHDSFPIFLTRREVDLYYSGFSNRTLWPLFHYFSSYCTFERSEWDAYRKVNEKFVDVISRACEQADSYWIHDYHLMLLPHFLRSRIPRANIGFFLHIPFPSSEVFRTLPWRREVLEGLLGSDLIGFHTYEYARHFLSSVLRLLGHEHEFGAVSLEGRTVRVDNFPMGVDAGQIDATLSKAAVQRETNRLRSSMGGRDVKIILSVDRLDYSKGIPQRLKAVEAFLSQHTHWQGKIVFIMLCVPSRTKVRDYALLKQEVERLVGQINGRFGSPRWTPVSYMYRSLPFEKLLPLYAAADVALVTPVRDGMNLVAKEYVAARADESGVLILSGTAGASAEMGESLIVNVYNTDEIVESLTHALEMPEAEQRQRMKAMRKRIFAYDLNHWTRSFIAGIDDAKELKSQRAYRELSGEWRKTLLKDYRGAQCRLLMLDYDGTLISFAKRPEDARPDAELKRLLILLSRKRRNKLAIVSGRDRATLERWLGDIPCILVAEHGAWIRWDRRSAWIAQTRAVADWKSRILPILEDYAARVPGALIEEKEFGIAWHYRKANPELGELRSHELFDNLNEFLANTDLQLMQGNKVLEVRPSGVNKGEAAQTILARGDYDFILALGDDWTDEDLFRVLPAEAYSVKIGFGATQARFFLESPRACRRLLLDL